MEDVNIVYYLIKGRNGFYNLWKHENNGGVALKNPNIPYYEKDMMVKRISTNKNIALRAVSSISQQPCNKIRIKHKPYSNKKYAYGRLETYYKEKTKNIDLYNTQININDKDFGKTFHVGKHFIDRNMIFNYQLVCIYDNSKYSPISKTHSYKGIFIDGLNNVYYYLGKTKWWKQVFTQVTLNFRIIHEHIKFEYWVSNLYDIEVQETKKLDANILTKVQANYFEFRELFDIKVKSSKWF